MSAKSLADKVGLKSAQAILQYERGERQPSIEILRSIASALRVPLYMLLGDKSECSRELIIAIDEAYPSKSSWSILDVLSKDTSIPYTELENTIKNGTELSINHQNELFSYLKKLDQSTYEDLYKRFRRNEYYAQIIPICEDDIRPILKNYITEDFKTYGINYDETLVNKLVAEILEFKRWKMHELMN